MISSIFHISDIHIFPYKRHSEYRLVFDKFFKYVRKHKDENSVIALTGDIVNNKIDITPELIDILGNFFKECADLCPTILVLGNHDYSTNMSRLDPFTPILKFLNHPNLHFWKESGVYELNGVHFSVHSLLGERDKWISANQFDAKHKVAIFHGPVISDVTRDSHIVHGHRAVDVSIFDGFDITLLGDLHFGHFSNKKKTVGYPGSCLQLSHGEEPTGHGFLVWDVVKRKAKFVELENDYCYYTLNVKNDYYEIPKGLPKNVRLKVKHENSSPETISEAIKEFGKKYYVLETTKFNIKPIHKSINKDGVFGNSRDVEYQNSLITDYLKGLGINDDVIQEVIRLNITTNVTINSNTLPRGINWIPKKLTFSNMFSYGEDNELDFTDFEGVYGIGGKNYEGKSSLLDILCFCLYDKSTRASKAVNILNINKNWFKCKFSFEFDGKEYFIERFGQKNEKTGNVRVDVKFWCVDDLDNEVILTGDDRDATNKIIREYVGTYDDFVMTVLSTQYDNQSFVDKSQKERKELLYRFLDISIYDDLYKVAKEINREQQILIKNYEQEDLYKNKEIIDNLITTHEIELENTTLAIDWAKSTLQSLNNDLLNLNREIQQVSDVLDIEEIGKTIRQLETEINTNNNLIDVYNEQKHEFIQKQNEINLDGIDIERFVQDTTLEIEQEKLIDQRQILELVISKTESEIEFHEQNVTHLTGHEYDPNCKFCCNNEFVINAQKSIELLPKLKNNLLFELSNKSAIEGKEFENRLKLNVKQNQLKQIEEFNKITNEVEIVEKNIQYTIEKINNKQNQLREYRDRATRYFKNEQVLVRNQELKTDIQICQGNIKLETNRLNILEDDYRKIYTDISAKKAQLDVINGKITKYEELLKSSYIYDLYTRSLNRDGVPYLILERVMPLIEYEVNEVLNKVVDFTVRLESTPERYIHAFIDYGNDQTWSVEMTSGMERFVLSLAFRNALTEITSLSHPSFLAIDEGFGVLDSDNLIAMSKLFDFLRTRYNYLLIVSHIDTMKDLVEKKIQIQKVDGYSTIIQND